VLPVLWFTLRLIFGIDFGRHNAGLRARMVWRCPPPPASKHHIAQTPHGDTMPVFWRSLWLQPAFTRSTVLAAQRPKFVITVPAQPMRAKKPIMTVVGREHRPPANHSAPYQLMNLIKGLFCRTSRVRHLPTRIAIS
jgi:hypothetical protein